MLQLVQFLLPTSNIFPINKVLATNPKNVHQLKNMNPAS